MKLENKTILIVSNEPWGEMWYSKHNWAFELSKNNQVYFVNPPRKRKFTDFFRIKISLNKYKENLHILDYSNIIPFSRFNLFFKINEKLVFNAFTRLLKNKKDIIFWTFDAFRLIYPKYMNLHLSIYFIADRYEIPREQILINNVDKIISVSDKLTSDIKDKAVLNISHGLSETEFSSSEIINDSFILYIGGIDYRLDYELIEELLKEFPKEKFLFIGKINRIDNDAFKRIFTDKKYKNLEYKPAIHFKKLKNYIAVAKVCLAPMKIGVQGNSINHHKLLQYLAFGKPVLSAKFDDYQDNNLLLEYSSKKEALNKLRNILLSSEEIEVLNKRVNFTKQFEYSSLTKKIEEFLS